LFAILRRGLLGGFLWGLLGGLFLGLFGDWGLKQVVHRGTVSWLEGRFALNLPSSSVGRGP
jgi:hypothetical protein